jgi:ABC-2 type transport system ATP-binding protein
MVLVWSLESQGSQIQSDHRQQSEACTTRGLSEAAVRVSGVSIVVDARGLRKSYGPRLVLDGVTMTITAGEVVGLLGPNGAGKTTTLSILATLLEADSGEVRICGVTPNEDIGAIRRNLGFVPQSVALYPSLSAIQNLALFARVHGASKHRARADSIKMLEMVGLAGRAHDPVLVLSSGMQRRLNLACGMVHHPSVLMLDEPTVGVDPQSREQILSIVRSAAEAGAAVIYSTHYMDEVERLCDRVLLIDGGRLIAEGTVDELIARAGGQARMEITFQSPPSADWCAGLAGVTAAAPPESGAKIALGLPRVALVSEVLERARLLDCRILEYSVHSPNLSDAFIALTGHALRDPDSEAR